MIPLFPLAKLLAESFLDVDSLAANIWVKSCSTSGGLLSGSLVSIIIPGTYFFYLFTGELSYDSRAGTYPTG